MSTLTVDTLTNQEPRMATAWVNFNGTGTVSIRDQYNVASLTDIGVGRYSVTISSSLSDTNYSVISSASKNLANNSYISGSYNHTVSSVSIRSATPSDTDQDVEIVSAAILGGQA